MSDFRNADEPDCLEADEASALLQVVISSCVSVVLCRRARGAGSGCRSSSDHRGAARGSC